MGNKTVIAMCAAALLFFGGARAQLPIQPGTGLGPFVLGKTFEENTKKLKWKNAVAERDKTNNRNIHVIYHAEGITFFYSQQNSKQKTVSSFKSSVLDSIEITSPLYPVEGSGLAVGKKYGGCAVCEKIQNGISFICDSLNTKKGIKFFCDSLCTIAFIRLVPSLK
jgi:hypothetical protein